MFFSTIIPSHNRAHLLGATLDSALAQEFADQEIIVVDAGSTDGTDAVLARYSGRITVVRGEAAGPGATRNLGIAQAKGEYITFLDSDDLWFPWTLATYRRAIEEHSLPAFIAGTHVDFRDTPTSLPTTAAPFRATRYRDYLEAGAADNLWIGTCAVAVRADVLREVGGFATGNVNAEDSDLWLRLGAGPGFSRITSPPVFAYRRHDASAIANLTRTHAGMMQLIEAERRGQYPGGRARQNVRWKILTSHTRPASLACLRSGMRTEAWQIFRATLRWNVSLGRAKYLLAFPLLAGCSLFSRVPRAGG